MSKNLIKVPNSQNLYYTIQEIPDTNKLRNKPKQVKRYIMKYLDEFGQKKQKTIGDNLELKEIFRIQRDMELLIAEKKKNPIKHEYKPIPKPRKRNIEKVKQKKEAIVALPEESKPKTSFMTFDDIAQMYFNNNIDKKTNKQSIRVYENHIKEDFASSGIYNITENMLKRYYEALQEKMALKSAANIMQLMLRIYNYALKKKKFVGYNPVKDIDIIHADNERKSYLTLEQIQKLLEDERIQDDFDLYLFVLLSTRTGARAGSIMNITKIDVDLDNNSLELFNFKKRKGDSKTYEGYFDNKTKRVLEERLSRIGLHDKVISITYAALRKRLQRVLDELFNYPIRDNKIELDDKGKVISYKKLLYSKKGIRNDADAMTKEDLEIMAKKRAKRIVVHSLRHSFAYNYLQADNSSIFDLKTLLDHSDIKMTIRYSKSNKERNKSVVRNMFNDDE